MVVSRGPLGRARKADRLVELTHRVGRGDKECFAQLYDLTSSCVYGAALQFVQSSRLATIVTEKVYVEVWRLAPRYDPSESSVLAWMMAMAHRRSTHEVEAMADRPASDRDADANDQSDRVARHPDGPFHPHAERAGRALSALRDPHRQAVVLAYFGECSQGEVARILELPVSQVTPRIRHGLVGLRRELEVAR